MNASRRTLALAIGTGLAVIGLAWVALVLPAQHRASSGAAEIQQLRGELAAAARSPVEVATAPRVSPELRAALRRAMPEQPMSGRVIGALSLAAHEAGVGLSSISLGAASAATAQSGTTAIPVQLTVRGGYREIVAFVDRLDALVARSGRDVRADGRLITFGGMEIDAGPDAQRAGSSLTSRMQATAYAMPAAGSAP